MNISRSELMELAVQVAQETFGAKIFNRRALMLAVEERVKKLGLWTPEDDEKSGSADPKSKGLANIDWVLSTLKLKGRLLNPNYDRWHVP